MNRIRWLFFDLGSTLVDERECIRWRCNYIIEENKLNEKEFVDKVYECARTEHSVVKTVADYYGVKVPKWPNDLEKLYPDAKNVLEELSAKYKLGIIANQRLGTMERLEKWGIVQYFDVVVASEEAGCAKPEIKIFDMALEEAKCLPKEAVMIGDRLDNDVAPAKKIGMKTIWVRQGFSQYRSVQNESERPDYEIKDLSELLKMSF